MALSTTLIRHFSVKDAEDAKLFQAKPSLMKQGFNIECADCVLKEADFFVCFSDE